MRILSWILIIIIILAGVSFATLNSEKVLFNYYLGSMQITLSFLLVCVFSVGCVLGASVSGVFTIKAKLRIYRLKQKLKTAEKEINNLRSIPLQDRP